MEMEQNKKSVLERFLRVIEVLGNKIPNPMLLFISLCIIVIAASAICSFFNVSAVNPVTGEAPYLAIHRCATAAEALERGVMGFMFDRAEAIARSAGKQSIRIDTHPGNRAMRAFLAKQGYTELSAFELTQKGGTETDLTRIAYEKLV